MFKMTEHGSIQYRIVYLTNLFWHDIWNNLFVFTPLALEAEVYQTFSSQNVTYFPNGLPSTL